MLNRQGIWGVRAVFSNTTRLPVACGVAWPGTRQAEVYFEAVLQRVLQVRSISTCKPAKWCRQNTEHKTHAADKHRPQTLMASTIIFMPSFLLLFMRQAWRASKSLFLFKPYVANQVSLHVLNFKVRGRQCIHAHACVHACVHMCVSRLLLVEPQLGINWRM